MVNRWEDYTCASEIRGQHLSVKVVAVFFKFRTQSETKLKLVDQYEIYFKYMDQLSISRTGRNEGGG